MSDNNNTPTPKYCENCKPEPGKIIHTKIDNTCRDCGRLLGGSLFKVPTPTPKEWDWEVEMENDDWLHDPETLSPMYGQSEVHYNANKQKIKDFIISKVIPQEKEKSIEEVIKIIKTPMSTEFEDVEEESADYSIEDFRTRLLNLLKNK